MKTVKINKNIESILNVTKNVIKQSNEFNDYYKNNDNNLYNSQLPLLMQRSRIREALYFKNKNDIQDLVLKRLPTEEQESNDNIIKEEEEKNSKLPLTQIRKLKVRSKKLPPLCPFYNKKGELLPEVVSTSKALLCNYDTDSKFNLTHNNYGNGLPLYNFHFLTPMNKSKMKKVNLYENIEIHYEEFQNEVLFEKKYESLKYNHDDIYNRSKFYKEVINDLIGEIIKFTDETQQIEEGNKILENKEIKKEKIFEWGKNKRSISLSLNSINIKIKSINDNKIYFEYNLPVNLLPIFYFKDLEKFKLFIISLIHFDESSQKFELEKNIYTIINNLLVNSRNLKTKFDLLEDIEERDDKIQKIPELKKAMTLGKNLLKNNNNLAKSMMNMMNIGNINSNNLFAGTNVDIVQKKKIKKSTFRLNPKKEKEKNDLYLNYNVFNFYWKTLNNTFQVCVEMPLIIFNVPSYNITIKQYINYELLFYLFSIKFDSWDFYVIKYISSFKRFRMILSQMASMNHKKDVNIFLENPKIKNYDFSDDKIINILTLKNNNFDLEKDSKHKKVSLNQANFEKIEEEDKEHNNESGDENAKKEINIANTVKTEETIKLNNKEEKQQRDEINTLIEQKCFRAKVTVTDLDKCIANEYIIHFNYKQFNKFKFMEKYMDKITFLIKFIDVNYENSTIKFDYDGINTFKEKSWISQLKKYNWNLKLNLDMDNTSRNNINMNNMTNKINTENKINSNSKNKKKKKMKKNNSTIKLDEKVNQNNNTNNNPNKAEFYGDTSRNTLSVEIREPEIILKYMENKGKMKKKIFKITAEDENKLISNQKNILDVVSNICDLSQKYIQKEAEKEEIPKNAEKNLYLSYNKKLIK